MTFSRLFEQLDLALVVK